MILLIIGALAILVVLAIAFIVVPLIDSPEGNHHASRPATPPAGREAPGLSAPVVEAARRSPGVWLWASRTPRQKKAARPAGRPRKTTALRRWPTAIRKALDASRQPSRSDLSPLQAAGRRLAAPMEQMQPPGLGELHPRPAGHRDRRQAVRVGDALRAARTWWAWHRPRRPLSTEDRITVAVISQMHHEDTGGFAAAPIDVPGRETPGKDRAAASGDQVIAHASLGGEPGHPAGDHQAPTRGDAEGRDEPARAPTTGPAPGAELTGSLSLRQLIDGPRVASAPPPGPGTNGTRLLSREDRLAAELAATSPWTTNIPFDRWESDTFVGGILAVPAEAGA